MSYRRASSFFVALVLSAGLASAVQGQEAPNRVTLYGPQTAAAAGARSVGRVSASEAIPLTLALAVRDTARLNDLLRRLYDPQDPLYGHYLTPTEFSARFSPTPEQCAAVARFARSQGLTVVGLSADRLLMHLSAPSAAVESAFGVHLYRFLDARGRRFHAPDAAPSVPATVAPLIAGVVGLDDSAVLSPHSRPYVPDMADPLADVLPLQTGSGPGSALQPKDIRTAYGLTSAGLTGAGQTLAVVELDGYAPSDIAGYESAFGLPPVPLNNVLIDGGSGPLGSGQAEVTLDIELQVALAPGASQILVYEGPNSDQGLLDIYSQIAADDQAKQISTSWGLAEDEIGTGQINAENPTFQQMAAQGQTFYAAAGDSGSYDDGQKLSVDDPASQPYVTGVGGTSLQTAGAGGPYGSETTWNDGGGGISAAWPLPSWQQGVLSAKSLGSTTMRNVPDVALDADPNTGYAIYLNGGWQIYGGTSCASPLWAAFTALVNQNRAAVGAGPLGFANPALYAIGTQIPGDFHDIADGTTNDAGHTVSGGQKSPYYPAVTGHDDATGWGSFNGASLLADLTPPAAPDPLTATAGNAQVSLTWTASPRASAYNVYRGTSAGGEGATPYATGLTGTAYTDTGATNGTTYYYLVRATSLAGQGAATNEVNAEPTAPAPPTTTTSTPSAPAVHWLMADPNIGHVIGRADTGGWSANTAQDPPGFLQYGPYATHIPPGQRVATWNLLIDNNTYAGDPGPVVELQVYDATAGALLATRDVRRAEFAAPFRYQPFALPFSLPAAGAGDRVELRVYWFRYAYVREQDVAVSAFAWGALDPNLGHVIGRADTGGWSANTAQDPPGFLQYGPYTTQIVVGAQTAFWSLLIDNNTYAGDPGPVVELQVYDATAGALLATRDVRRAEFAAPFRYQPFALPFSLPAAGAGDRVELRVYWFRYAYVREQDVAVGGTP